MKNKFYNRKTKEVVFLANFFLTLFVANFALAQVSIENPLKANSVVELIDNVVNAIISIGGVLAFLMIAVGVFTLVTSAGDPRRLDLAKKIIFWTVIGMITLVFSKGLFSLIKGIIGA